MKTPGDEEADACKPCFSSPLFTAYSRAMLGVNTFCN